MLHSIVSSKLESAKGWPSSRRPPRSQEPPPLAEELATVLDEPFRTRYCFAMSTEQLIADAMALPLSERVSLAQALWESIDAGLPDADERAAVVEAINRDKELSSGLVTGRTHEEVMKAARRALE